MKDRSWKLLGINSATRLLQLCLTIAGLTASSVGLAEFDINPQPGTIQFDSANYSASEADGQAEITLIRSGGSFGGLTVDILIGNTGDTAEPADYSVSQPTEISWADGDTATKTFTINLLTDAFIEGSESLSLSVQGSANSLALNNQITTVGSPALANLTILDSTVATTVVDQLNSTDGNYQRGVSGDTLNPFIVTALNAAGAPMTGESITWEILPANGGTLLQVTTTTDGSGQSSNTLTLNTSVRMIVRATVANGTGTPPPLFAESLNTPTPAEVVFVVNGGLADVPGLSKNQKSVAKAMDSMCTALAALGASRTAEQNDLLATCTRLAGDPGTLAANLDVLSYQEINAQGRVILETAKLQSTSIHRRLADLRAGSRGVNLAGLNINIDGTTLPNAVIAALFGHEARGGSAGEESSAIASRWGSFINADLVVGERDKTSLESGFNFRARGITAGADYRISDQLVVGSALGYASKTSDFKGNAGDMDIDNWHLSAYGSYYRTDSFYLDGLFRLGRNNIDTRRQISLPGDPLQKGMGDTTGWEYAASVSSGYEFSRNALTLGPYGRLGYIKSSINGYTESASNPGGAGAGSVLIIDNQNIDSLTAVLGGQMSYAISTRSNVFLLQLNGEWQHEFRDNSRAIAAQFAYDPTRTSFNIDSDSPDRNYFNLGLGISAMFANGRSGFIRYESRLGQNEVRQYWVNAGVRLEL